LSSARWKLGIHISTDDLYDSSEHLDTKVGNAVDSCSTALGLHLKIMFRIVHAVHD
jgi:hypothetical protein